MFEPVIDRIINGGWQNIYRFDNGYGASVVQHSFSYGREMAVIKFTGEDNTKFELVYDTPITDDVLGHLTEDDVNEYLKEISEL